MEKITKFKLMDHGIEKSYIVDQDNLYFEFKDDGKTLYVTHNEHREAIKNDEHRCFLMRPIPRKEAVACQNVGIYSTIYEGEKILICRYHKLWLMKYNPDLTDKDFKLTENVKYDRQSHMA